MALCVAINLTHHRVDSFNRGPLERLSLAALRCRRQDLEPNFNLGRLNAAGEAFLPARKNEVVEIVLVTFSRFVGLTADDALPSEFVPAPMLCDSLERRGRTDRAIHIFLET